MLPRKFYSTAAKRQAAADRLRELAAQIGIEIAVEPASLGNRELWVQLSLAPYRCNVDLDGETSVGCYLAHWHTMPEANGAVYPADFGVTISGDINRYHFRKATTFADTFDQLLGCLSRGFTRLQEGLTQ